MAVRVSDIDQGATGGVTSVELYWAGGFREENLYSGGWKSVEPSDILWKSDTEVLIRYEADYPKDNYHFETVSPVKVTFIPK